MSTALIDANAIDRYSDKVKREREREKRFLIKRERESFVLYLHADHKHNKLGMRMHGQMRTICFPSIDDRGVITIIMINSLTPTRVPFALIPLVWYALFSF